MDWKILSSFCQNTPRPRSFWSHAWLTLWDQLHVLSFACSCWRSDHICSPEPEAPGGPLAMGMASMAHHQRVHAHLFSSVSFPLCCATALKDKLLLYNLYGRRKKTGANDFYQGAGHSWNMNWFVGSFANASVDTGPIFRVRSIFKFLLESVFSSDHWEFKMRLALQFLLGFWLLDVSPLSIEFPVGCLAPLQVTEGTATLAYRSIHETLNSPNFPIQKDIFKRN